MKMFRVLQGDTPGGYTELTRQLLTGLLPEGCELEIVNSWHGDELLAVAAIKPFDLLLLYPSNNLRFPCRMFPEIAGINERILEFTKAIKQTFDAPVWVLTGLSDDPALIGAFEATVDWYSRLPFEVDEFHRHALLLVDQWLTRQENNPTINSKNEIIQSSELLVEDCAKRPRKLRETGTIK